MAATPLYKTQELQIYNSISGQKEIFKSIIEGNIGMYVCGPTVYSNVHLGNCRTFISFDLIFNCFCSFVVVDDDIEHPQISPELKSPEDISSAVTPRPKSKRLFNNASAIIEQLITMT